MAPTGAPTTEPTTEPTGAPTQQPTSVSYSLPWSWIPQDPACMGPSALPRGLRAVHTDDRGLLSPDLRLVAYAPVLLLT
jgi:hypothetical protein